jgi:iron complex transport system ATP-binding protein
MISDKLHTEEPVLRMDHLSTGYVHDHHTKVVARDITAQLHRGELTCLLGPNGAGKSTLLRTLSAFLQKLEGEILLEGKPLGEYTQTELARRISVVLTERVSLQNMTVRELVGMGRYPYTGFWGKLRTDDRRIIDESIRLIKIEDLAERQVGSLSDGERQKALIAKALSQQTPLIFLDEPTAFLDYPSKVEIMRLLHQLTRTQHKAIFLSTHDLELALQIADTVWLMDKEKGVRIGSPQALAQDGSIGAYFERDGIRFDRQRGTFIIENN